jgi:hypothetical protein
MKIQKFDPIKNTIYVDLDGVLADFNEFVERKMGRTFQHEIGPADDDEMWEFLKTVSHLYLQLKPTPYAFELWHEIRSCSRNVEILTAVPRRNPVPTAMLDKKEWVSLYFSPTLAVNFGPFSKDKWTWAKNGDILIDDRTDNIRDWINCGFGIGILHDHKNFKATVEQLRTYK